MRFHKEERLVHVPHRDEVDDQLESKRTVRLAQRIENPDRRIDPTKVDLARLVRSLGVQGD